MHFTITAGGKAKLGPTAIPVYWHEHYQGLKNFNVGEMFEIVMREAGLLLKIVTHERVNGKSHVKF